MILVIDNYDSFTYNLVQVLGALGEEINVIRNDELGIEEIKALRPDLIVISPGPGNPDDAGISKTVIREMGAQTPILGICLGNQCIGDVYGGRVIHAPRLMHGKTSPIYHYKHAIFDGIPSPFVATRYHSLIVEEEDLPDVLEIIAFTKEGEIMGLHHKQYPVVGLQFHPESILTPQGEQMIRNFVTNAMRVQA